MGGIWFLEETDGEPRQRLIVWRAPFPASVQDLVITDSNRAGTITNLELELAGTIVQLDVLA
jgi:hypothetical protein